MIFKFARDSLRIITLLCILFFSHNVFATNGWRILAPGIEYQALNPQAAAQWSHIHVFRINLEQNEVSLMMATDLARRYASVATYAQYSNALLAINGGFFDNNYRPLGLRIYNNRWQVPLKNISWWGIFYIYDHKAYITNLRKFRANEKIAKHINFAIQSGPRLLIDGRIPSLKAGKAERSALGITPDGRIIILITDHFPVSTTELAAVMQSAPLNCQYALNLDGGSSSQLLAQINTFTLQVHGLSNVSDAIIVKSRNAGT